jgi:glutaredoxin 2
MEELFNDAAVLQKFTSEGHIPLYPIVRVLDWVEGLEYPRSHFMAIDELTTSKPLLRAVLV